MFSRFNAVTRKERRARAGAQDSDGSKKHQKLLPLACVCHCVLTFRRQDALCREAR